MNLKDLVDSLDTRLFTVGGKKYRLKLGSLDSFETVREMIDMAMVVGESRVARDVAAELRRLAAKKAKQDVLRPRRTAPDGA